jgi:hypothetical protein
MVRGPRCDSIPIRASRGYKLAARIDPTIAQSIQAGKFAPAMLTTGSHPASANVAKTPVAARNDPGNSRRAILTAAKIARMRT